MTKARRDRELVVTTAFVTVCFALAALLLWWGLGPLFDHGPHFHPDHFRVVFPTQERITHPQRSM